MKNILCACLLLLQFSDATSQSIDRNELFSNDPSYGHYIAWVPEDTITGVLVLLGGYGNRPEDVLVETKLPNTASANNILTIIYGAGEKIYVDEVTEQKLATLFKDVISRYHVSPEKFVIGGYSAGGSIALRYTEMCNQYPGKYPVRPKGVFMVDSPIDIFTLWDNFEQTLKNRYSVPAVEEAENATRIIKQEHGVPKKNIPKYVAMTPFTMNKAYGDNEKYLKNTAVRAYHDVDIAWRLINRRQVVHSSNYEVTAELINRLLQMGNDKAEFMQTFRTGYRANGQRHPHSWSIVDEEECIGWIKALFKL